MNQTESVNSENNVKHITYHKTRHRWVLEWNISDEWTWCFYNTVFIASLFEAIFKFFSLGVEILIRAQICLLQFNWTTGRVFLRYNWPWITEFWWVSIGLQYGPVFRHWLSLITSLSSDDIVHNLWICWWLKITENWRWTLVWRHWSSSSTFSQQTTKWFNAAVLWTAEG